MFELDTEAKSFINERVRNMLARKLRVDEKYLRYHNEEVELLRELVKALPAKERDLLEDYKNAVIDRENHGLYFAYLVGLQDGVACRRMTEEFETL